MSNKEMAMQLLAAVPDCKMDCVIAYMQGLLAGVKDVPNSETLEAMKELENDGGETFEGSAHDFVQSMLED